ncbi:MAG: tetratricopeptide repeat protein [Aeromicrobium sp.]|uniref:CHAT domain-containing protein n=1 Tax=Aeromicrobium sp. TaxID=1871063 RepID=UPI0039E70C54
MDASTFFERAEALAGLGRFDDAVAELRRGLAQVPDDADLLGYLGWLSFFAADPETAEDCARRTLALRPHDARALNTLCEVTVALGRHDEARAVAEELCERYPDWPTSHLHLAYALIHDKRRPFKARRERRARAREAVDRAVSLDPDDVEVLRRAGALLLQLHENAEAEKLAERGLALEPEHEGLMLVAAHSKQSADPVASAGGPLVDAIRSASAQAAANKLFSGVLATNPQQRGVAREMTDGLWTRIQFLASAAVFLAAALMVIAYLVVGDPAPTSHRTRVKAGEALLMLPLLWLLLIFTVRSGLPKRFIRRLFAKAWWVWLALPMTAAGGLAVMALAMGMATRSTSGMVATQGSYVGGITRAIGYTVCWLVAAELLIVFARLRADARTGLFPHDDEGDRAALVAAKGSLAGLGRVGFAAVFALVPVFAQRWETRPEAAGGFAAVAVALAVPPLVTTTARWARVLRGPRQKALVVVSLLVAGAGLALAVEFADRHADEYDPPPTPFQEDLRERLPDPLDVPTFAPIDPVVPPPTP